MRPVSCAVLTLGLCLAFVAAAMAQELRSYHGRVLFISGTSMGFAPDSGSSFDVDLTQVDQSAYEMLTNGQAITVVGYVSRDGNKLIAVSITPDP